MELIKKRILKRTHSGLGIYSFITNSNSNSIERAIMVLRGVDCEPYPNPFNDYKPTLWIKIVNGLATHTCTENSIPHGNAFDFAALHFKLSGDALFVAMNEALNLNLQKKSKLHDYNIDEADCINSFKSLMPLGVNTDPAPTIIQPPDQKFSLFHSPIRNVTPFKNSDIYEVYSLIKSNKYAEQTIKLREITDVKEARKFKAANFDYVTFSGVFNIRKDAGLITHSNLIVIDFDHLPDVQKVKSQLLADPSFTTALLFTSPSGDGLKWVIEIDTSTATHQEWFVGISNYLKTTYNIEVDGSGKDVSRACFLPHDSSAYIHPNFNKS